MRNGQAFGRADVVRAWALSLAMLALRHTAAALADDPIPVQRPPLRIEITRDSTPETATVRQDVAVNGKIKEVFQDVSIAFEPEKNLGQVKLVSAATGDALSVGVDARSPVYLKRSPNKITNTEDGWISLHVSDPKSLKPGVYRGQLTAVLRDYDQVMNAAIAANWDIELVVHGRRLVALDFDRASGGKLRVGTPASLLARVDTVGCDLGKGFLKLDWSAPGEERQRALYIPLPLERALDPAAAFKTDSEQGCHPQWRDSPMETIVTPLSGEGASSAAGQQYEVRVVAPDCFLPGQMQAAVEWEQANSAPSAERLTLSTKPTPVLPGALVHPRIAFVNERVKVLVRTDQDFGANLPLQVSQPDGKTAPVEMVKRKQQAGAQGTVVEYAGSYVPAVMGAYQLVWPETDQRDAVVQNLGEPPGFQACFGADQYTQTVEVFAGAPPFWITENLGWNVTSPDACRFWYAPQLLRNASLEAVTLFRGRPGEQLAPYDPETAPLVRFALAPEQAPPNPAEGDKDPKKPPAPKVAAAGERWPMGSSPDNAAWLDLTVDLDREAEGHPRHTPAEYDFTQRFILHVQDTRGVPMVRIAQVPLHVQVSTAGQYYRRIGIGLGIVLAILVAGIIMFRKAAGSGGAKSRGPAPPDPMAQMAEGGIFSASAPPPRSVADDNVFSGGGMSGGAEPAARPGADKPPAQAPDTSDPWD